MYFSAAKLQVFFSWEILWVWESSKWLELGWESQLCLSHLLILTTTEAGPFQVTAQKSMQRNKREICIRLFVIRMKGTGHDFDLVQPSCQVPKYMLKAGY